MYFVQGTDKSFFHLTDHHQPHELLRSSLSHQRKVRHSIKLQDLTRGAIRPHLKLFVPLGISFYTFQSMGYLIDVYNGKYAPKRNLAKFALFVSFFPQLIQGPIGRYDALAPQLLTPHQLELKNIRRGLVLMLWGFFKKKVIADRALPFVSQVFGHSELYGGAVIAAGVLMYFLQQYADFSGGIDLVTVGAELIGIHLVPNFKRPYFSVSLGDFWRCWHISLGTWMRDYIFYPFALTRPMRALSKKLKKHVNLSRTLPAALGNILVFLLVGLWHGLTANYILWGLYNGLILAFSALLEPTFRHINAKMPSLVKSKPFHIFRILRTFLIVNIGWYFDRCLHAGDAFSMLKKTLFAPHFAQLKDGTLLTLGLTEADFVILAFSSLILFTVSLAQERGIAVREWIHNRPLPLRWAILYFLLFFTMFFFMYGSSSEFMYAAF